MEAFSKEPKPVLILPDLRVKKGRNAAELSFCGQQAWTSTFTAEMAITYQRPLIPIRVTRDKKQCVRIEFFPDIRAACTDKQALAQRMNDVMSQWVMEQPSAWQLWNTNRWG